MAQRARRRGKRRNAQVDRGLRTMATIVAVIRQSNGEVDDPAEEADIDAALAWIGRAG